LRGPLAAPQRDNVCFDFFAFFRAVQTPATSKTLKASQREIDNHTTDNQRRPKSSK